MASLLEMEKEIAALKAQLAAKPEAVKAKKYVNGGKFWTITSRYVNGRFVVADPEHPVVVMFSKKNRTEVDDDGNPVDGTLRVYTDAAPVEKRAKPFAEVRRGPPDRKASDMDRPEARPSDEDPSA